MSWLFTFYKPLIGYILVALCAFHFVMAAQIEPVAMPATDPAPASQQITGNPAVDQTFAGIERASGWTDRALMLGMLVVVLLMCGYFLKMANDEIKRGRTTLADTEREFIQTVERITKSHDEITRDAIKQIALSGTALTDSSRQMEANRAIAEKVLRLMERLEAELVTFNRRARDREDRDDG